MQEFINMLSPNLEFISMYSNDDCIIFQVQSKIKDPICPYCGKMCIRDSIAFLVSLPALS